MLFNSYIFILLFLPLVLAGFYFINSRGRYRAANIFLIGMSLWFYGYFNPAYLLIICGSMVFNFLVSRIMERLDGRPKKLALWAGVLANIGLIFVFKYYDFFIGTVNTVFRSSFALKHIALPLGISFFTFQQISYLADSFKGEIRGCGFDEYLLFVSFFPQLVAGPIVLHSELIPQFRDPTRRKFDAERFSKGLYVFAIGLFKKVIVADTFGAAVAVGFGEPAALSTAEAWVVSLAYTFQLYFDFSGYCDMASGIGLMLGFELPQNFNSPYKSLSITEFWSRWHMSLTRFLRTYIYFPLGGNRRGKWRTYINVMIVYLVSGLWHGANWTFVLWGALHGVLCCLNRGFRKTWDRLPKPLRWCATFLTVNVLWILFRADSISDAVTVTKRLVSMAGFGVRQQIRDAFMLPLLRMAGCHWAAAMAVFFAGALTTVLCLKNSGERELRPSAAQSLLTAALLVWSIMSLSGISTFLYFDF